MGFETSFFAGETIDILRATRSVDPFSGEEGEYDWSAPQVVAQFFNDRAPFAPVLPNSSSVDVEKPDVTSPEYREDELMLFLPHDTNVDEDDRVMIKSGKYQRSEPYEIDSAKFYKNPFDGEHVIAIVTLKWKEG